MATGLSGAPLTAFNPQSSGATVKIVDATGHVYAEDTFNPSPPPVIGNAVPLLQSPVRTGGGAVFYADASGVVHRLKPDGSKSVAATFPLTSKQQELSYAVSPDGVHLIAIVLSTPPLHNPPPQQLGDPIYQAGGHWSLTVETADTGGTTTTTLQRDLGANFPSPTQIVGWDRNGPLATLNTAIGAQQALPSGHLFGSPLIHLAADGTHLDTVGGQGCFAVDELADGTVICDQDWSNFSVRNASGTALWQAALPSDNYYYGLWLSPDASAVAVQNLILTSSSVASSARQAGTGQPQKVALGWLDANTVVEADYQTSALSLYQARGLIKIRDLGVSGIFEGLL